MEKVYVPPLKIQGIKTKLVPLIRETAALDPDSVWVEPFMGSGVVGFNIKPRRALFADLNPHIIAFYNAVKSGGITAPLVRACLEEQGALLAERGADYYYAVRERFNAYHNPLDFLFLNRSCFNGVVRFNRRGEFNTPYGHKPRRFSKAYITKIVRQVEHMEECLKECDWRFVCQPYQDTIAAAPEDAFIYCDPPYIGRHVDYYDRWDEASEKELCRLLRASGRRFMLSTWEENRYRRNEYMDTLWGFCHKRGQAHFYHVGAREANRNAMLEALMTNYNPATAQ
ncbi:MAG: Dam family site-specific DNA-(adenine-N6)-methyltransferase [Oscillibacter sp.]|nr:Dam family site-specific DNA-(adenine-N6)-methyltransferase [Oscillibacter sp.]